MATVALPDHANLDQLRKQAKDLQRAVRAGAPEALAEVAERHPAGRPDDARAASFPLTAAQLVVARRYGFTSWTRLKHQLEVVEHYTRFPAGIVPEAPVGDASDVFLRHACLWYLDDRPERWGWPASSSPSTLPSPVVTSTPPQRLQMFRRCAPSSQRTRLPPAGTAAPTGPSRFITSPMPVTTRR